MNDEVFIILNLHPLFITLDPSSDVRAGVHSGPAQ